MIDWLKDLFSSSGPKDWGVIDDSGQWVCHMVSEERARKEFSEINYGKLVNYIRSNNHYNVVEAETNPHD